MTDDDVHLGRDGIRTGWIHAGVSGVAGVAVLAWGIVLGVPGGVLYIAFLLLGMSGSLLVLLTRLGSDAVVLREDDVLVRTGKEERTWAWVDLLEVGTGATGRMSVFIFPGCTVLLRPEGGPWDVPGPNAPFTVSLPIFGVRAQKRVREALGQACEARGVAFSTSGLRMAEQPRPGSSLRTDRARRGRTEAPPGRGGAA